VWDPSAIAEDDPRATPGWLLAFDHDPISGAVYAGNQNGEVTKWIDQRRVDGWGLGRRRSMIVDLTVHEDGRHIAVLDSRGFIEVLDAADGESLLTLGPIPGSPRSVSIHGDVLHVHSSDGRFQSWGQSD
jgi:hypothetical protein